MSAAVRIQPLDTVPAGELHVYWASLAQSMPHHFPVSQRVFAECLWNDPWSIMGVEFTTCRRASAAVIQNGRVRGFIQCGWPSFFWDGAGEGIEGQEVNFIRHYYFPRNAPTIGAMLWDRAQAHLPPRPTVAFPHLTGMSCNAHFGKLHYHLEHIRQFLEERGFSVYEENILMGCSLPLDAQAWEGVRTHFRQAWFGPHDGFETKMGEGHLATARCIPIFRLTGGMERSTVFVREFWVEAMYRRQGWGRRLLNHLAYHYRASGYSQFLLDAIKENVGAQAFYRDCGLVPKGGGVSLGREYPC